MSNEDELREIALREIAEEEIASEESESPSQMEALGLGAVEGVPFAKDVASAAEAMPVDISAPFITSSEVADMAQSTLDEEALGDFTDNFRQNKAGWDKAINEAEEKHPFTFAAGDIGAGVVALGALPGGVAASAALGAVEGVSRSENRSIEDVFAGAALGTAGHGVGKAIGKGIGFIGRKIGVIADKGIVEATGALNKSKTKKVKKHIMKFYKAKNGEEGTKKFAKEVLDMRTPEGKPFLEAIQSFEETALKAGELKDMYGKAMGKVLKEVDEVMPKVDTASLYDKLLQDIVDPLRKVGDPVADDLANNFQRRITSQFKDPASTVMKEVLDKQGQPVMLKEVTEGAFKDIKLSKLHDLKGFLAKEVRNSFDKSSGQLPQNAIELKKHVGITTEFIDNIISESGVDIPQAASYKALKRKWATANLVEELAEDESASRLNGPMEMIKNAFSVRGIAIGAIQKTMQVPTSVAATSAIALNGVLHSGKVPASLAVGLQTLSKHISGNPNSQYLKRLITASTLSSDAMRVAVSSSIAEINLSASPVKRTMESAKMKRASILTALEYRNKEMADKLNAAYESGDDTAIGAIMDGLSKDPSVAGLVEPGIGWNGTWYSEEDRASLEDEIRSSNLPAAQEMMYLEELNKQRKIPQVQPQEPYQRQYAPRDKNKHQY